MKQPMSKTKKIILWLVSPYTILIGSMIIYSISSFIFNGSSEVAVDGTATTPLAQAIINTGIYLAGVVAVILIPVSVVMAVVIGTRKP